MTLQVVKSKIGNIELIQVVELQIGPLLPTLLEQATKEEIKKIGWLRYPYVNVDGSLNAISQAIIIKKNKRVFIVDTCIGNDKERADSPDWTNLQTDFLETLTEVGISPESVTDVICTHLHMDHVGWNTHLKNGKLVPSFPNAKYHFAKKEFDYWQAQQNSSITGSSQDKSFEDSVIPVVEAGLVNLINLHDDLGDGIRVMPTIGHTLGHIAVICETGAEKVYLTGDSMHHPCQIAKPDWSMIMDYDPQASAKTRKEFLGDVVDTDAIIIGSHFSIPSMGNIIKGKNGGFEFKAVKKTVP